MVIDILEHTEDIIDRFVDLENVSNLTEFLQSIGYFSTVIWVYPDHWTNFSKTVAFDIHLPLYRQYARHQTYYVTPLGGYNHQYSMLKTDKSNEDMHQFWEQQLFQNKIALTEQAPDPSTSVRIDIMAISLSELSTDSSLLVGDHQMVLDVDLDFFSCQSVAENMMERFGWSEEHTLRLNDILSHHEYHPLHIPEEKHQESLITMMHLLNSNQEHWMEAAKDKVNPSATVPSISNLFSVFAEESDLDLFDLRQALHFLYRLQMEVGQEHVEPMQMFMAAHDQIDTMPDETEPFDMADASMPYKHRDVAERQVSWMFCCIL